MDSHWATLEELVRLAKAGIVTVEEAYAKATDKKAFETAMTPPKQTATPDMAKSAVISAPGRPSRAAS